MKHIQIKLDLRDLLDKQYGRSMHINDLYKLKYFFHTKINGQMWHKIISKLENSLGDLYE